VSGVQVPVRLTYQYSMKLLTLVPAVAGAADTAAFLARRLDLFRENPGRAAGSVVGLGLWLGLAASAAAEPRPGRRTLALGSGVALANGALLGAHLRAGIVRPRVFVGAALAALALGGAAWSLRTQ
jgi:hypothetical protein